MTPEHRLMNEVMVWCGRDGYNCFRQNVGLFYTARKAMGTDEDWVQIGTRQRVTFTKISTGLPPGFSDLQVIKPGGVVCFVETKVHPRKPTEDQKNFMRAMRKQGCRAGVAYTLEEAINIIDGTDALPEL